MKTNLKRLMSLVLTACMILSVVALAACGGGNKNPDVTTDNTNNPGSTDNPASAPSYTYQSYSTSLASNWNPHTWETSADDAVLSYLSSPFCTMSILNSKDGIYQWVYEMATSITDVTKDNQADLTKYPVVLPEGKEAKDVTEGYVYEIKLNPDAKWQNGTAIKADDYIYSMQALLDPAMKNYRANLYWSGESAVAGGLGYYNAGSTAIMDNSSTEALTYDFLKANTQTADGGKIYIAVSYPLSYFSGDKLSDYCNAYGAAYFDMDAYNALAALKDEQGLVPLTAENLVLLEKLISVPAWGEGPSFATNYVVYEKTFPVVGFDTVGLYKVDDYTIRYVNESAIDINYFLTSCTSTWLVYKDLYEGGKDTSGELVTTNYGTSVETSMSYGVYKLDSIQTDKQMVFVQNENWYGWDADEKAKGNLISYTNFEVDGQKVRQYMTTKVVIDVMTDDAAKLAFLSGKIDEWTPPADELTTYATSDQLYKVDETYTMSFFFNTGLDALKEMDKSKGNTNSVVLSNTNFRKAFSLGIDRTEWVTATAGYKPAYALMNNLYFYDIYNDPTSSYRNSDEAMQAVCNLYGVEYGAGKAYATLKDAYASINGYNLTEAKALMKTACDELVQAGLYKAGDPIVIRIGYKKGALDSTDNQQITLMNKYINAAADGSGFGKITLEGIGNCEDRYGDVPKGEFAIGYGAWGGAAFYPFRNFQVYMDSDNYSLNEAGCWDPATTVWELDVNGTKVSMTAKEWSGALTGTGKYAAADFKTKLAITAQLEEKFLGLYYRIPLAGSTACFLLSYKISYYTEDYNIMYDFGGARLMKYNYTDAEWADYVASQNGELKYE